MNIMISVQLNRFMYGSEISNVAEWLSLLLCIQEAPGLTWRLVASAKVFCGFAEFL
jgi:hypothetical protein